MDWKRQVKDYFSFTRKDRVGILVILFVMLGVIFLPNLVGSNTAPVVPGADSAWIGQHLVVSAKNITGSDSGNREENYSLYRDNNPREKGMKHPGELFEFDPNKLNAEGWSRLGLREKTIHTIMNYRSKGGQFRKAEDLQRIYGLFPDEFARIASYIRIGIVTESEAGNREPAVGRISNYPRKDNPVHTRMENHFGVIDINEADTTALISLPGIGSKLAARIVTFREKLGGFYSVEQVAETFGLQDSVFQKIKTWLKLAHVSLRKINVNTATEEELKAHPYIRWAIAKAISGYRVEHGNFSGPEDLKKILVVSDNVLNKLLPYLTW